MDAWIPITIAAAAAQTGRFMAQKHLKSVGLSTFGATLVRFVYSAPLVALAVAIYMRLAGQAWPGFAPGFWAYSAIGGMAQILATACVVALFSHRNFAVGISFKKTEVILTAVVGWIVLGDRVSATGAAALGLGFIGVLWLSDAPGAGARLLNRAAGLGLLSGVFFAISAVGYRGAVLAVETGDTALRAGVTLALVTLFQSLILGTWLIWREPGEMARVARAWRVALPTGILSMIGSFCWFAAFSLQSAAYVFALGQIELVFSILAATLWFREKITRKEVVGMVILTLSIIVLVAGA